MVNIVVYGFEKGCKFCDEAKNTLYNRGVAFKFVDVTKDENFKEFFKTVHTQVPQIYVNGICQSGGSKAADHVGETVKLEEVKWDLKEDEFDW